MGFYLHIPRGPLDNFIESIFFFEDLSLDHHLDRFLPDGNIELIFNLSDNPLYIYDNETLAEIQTCQHSWASGLRTRPITIPSGIGGKMLVVAFKKGKAYPFYPFPMSEISDIVIGSELIYKREILNLRERLIAAPTVAQKFNLVEAFLLQRARDSLEPNTASYLVEFAVNKISNKPTTACLRQIIEQIGYSQKHFINLFKNHVGIPPKQFMKIMRFQKALLKIEKENDINWSDFAIESGFYDQAHLIHDFKNYSGFTPSEYVKKKSNSRNYIPIE